MWRSLPVLCSTCQPKNAVFVQPLILEEALFAGPRPCEVAIGYAKRIKAAATEWDAAKVEVAPACCGEAKSVVATRSDGATEAAELG